MAVDESFIGRRYPSVRPYEVGREKIREFAQAIGDPNPAYTDPAAARALGHPDVIAPPTFVFSITFRTVEIVMMDPELGLDYSRVVHRSQKFMYNRPVCAGDVLEVTSTIESIKSLRGNEVLEIRGDLHDTAGELVVTTLCEMVARQDEES